jgi:hypothetical protein
MSAVTAMVVITDTMAASQMSQAPIHLGASTTKKIVSHVNDDYH